MSPCLYLDTARLGRMCPEAQAADHDFARLASEEGCSLYFEQFLRWGYSSLPPYLGRRYPALSFWAGVTAFKRDLKTVLAIDRQRQVFVANRSAQLVRLAARALCRRCENILVTDMEWPAYMAALTAECRRTDRILTIVPVWQAIFRDRIGQDELVGRLASHYRQEDCDGLFLSAVTFQGVQMPISETIDAIGPANHPRFTVVDGAQAFNHVPLRVTAESCDLLLTGCHKWLRAYHPLGLAVCCRRSSEKYLSTILCEMQEQGDIDDPLLTFTAQIESQSTESFSETVNLVPMFTAAAAVRRMFRSARSKHEELATQMMNADRVAEQAAAVGWRPTRPTLSLQSGVLLLEPRSRDTCQAPTDVLRQRFLNAGVALTAYEGGLLRTSLPDCLLATGDESQLQAAFLRCA